MYDRIGDSYLATRGSDPTLQQLIREALGDARSVVNVGAGTGSYEPDDRAVTAVEPSAEMIARRSADAAPAVQAVAEALPFEDDSFDAAMAVLTDHHWHDRIGGLREMRRVARRRAVMLTWDASWAPRFWLVRDYLPRFARLPWLPIEQVAAEIGATDVRPVPIPADCRDGFFHAYWRRPEAFLDPRVRASMTVFARTPPAETADALARLAADLDSGAWQERNADLLSRDALDLGYRLLIADYSGIASSDSS